MAWECEVCNGTDDECQACCPHDEHDHGICLDCGADRYDDLAGLAYDRAKGALETA